MEASGPILQRRRLEVCLRHTSLADGSYVGVQQVLMRHTDVRTTNAFTPDMAEAHGKVVGLALNGMGNGTEPGPSN